MGDISHFASLCTALSATIGTGNIVGVALAVSIGGPGSIFWMWIGAFLGIATKYAEGLPAIKYIEVGDDGKISGGPMYYIEKGLGSKILAKLYAISGVGVALFGIGTMTQSNSIAVAMESFGIPNYITAILLGTIVAIVTIGGIHRIAYISERLVPTMSAFYIGAALIILSINVTLIPDTLRTIFVGAFSPEAILGTDNRLRFY